MSLYVVATPIGNLNDISSRALEVLKSVRVVLCEDTRVTKKLLAHYDIHTKVESFHAHTSDAKIEKVLERLESGEDYALVTDAGTPAISDPGTRLVRLVYERFYENVRVIPIPGASAVVSALSVSGLPASDFLFLGFLPRKKGRKTSFEEIRDSKHTVVFYESPHRIIKTLETLDEYLGPDRTVVIARELTKIYEEVLRGTASEIRAVLQENSKQKGEFVVMVSSA